MRRQPSKYIAKICAVYTEKSYREQDDEYELGFIHYRTTEGIEVSLLGEIRTGHSMLLTKEDWKKPKQFNLVVMMKKIFQHLKIILPIILKKVEEYAILYE